MTCFNGGFEVSLAEWLCEACGFNHMLILKLCLMQFCGWFPVQEKLLCDLFMGDVVVFCCRRIARQHLDRGPGFLAAYCQPNVFDDVPQVIRHP